MIVTLTITKGRDTGRVIRLEEGETKTLGRGSQADIILSDVVVSRVHCRIRLEGGACYVRDMGSRNGTLVNGRAIKEEARLADDDALGLGTVLAEVRITADTLADAEAAEPTPASTPAMPIELEESPSAYPLAIDPAAERPSGLELATREEAEVAQAGGELKLEGEEERLIGMTVGGCRIEGLLGRDDISSVYRATQISMQRPVSLKILSPAMNGDRRSKERFIGAARAGGKLNHPNIMRVYDAGEEKGLTFVAMEFVAGKSVRRLVAERTRPLPLAQAIEIGQQIASALDYAHSVAFVHGHITADTILVTPQNIAKLGELGFVRTQESGVLPSNPARRLEQLQFVPPEQLAGTGLQTPQGDIYSLSVVLFLMVAGRMPFSAASEKELIEKIRKGAHEPVGRFRRDAPDRLARAIEFGMAVQVAQRCSRAADLLSALQQSHKGLA